MRPRILALVVVLLIVRPLAAQRAPTLRLAPATATHPAEFSAIVGVREFADGRVLVSDERDNRVVVADFAAKTVAPLSRTGNGPGEFRRASALFALANDSTVMPQDNGGNWIVFTGASRASTLSPERSIGAARHAMPGGFDGRGNALILTMSGPLRGVQGLDSLDIQLHARATHREQGIGRVRSPYGALPGRAPARGAVAAERKAGDGSDGRPSPAAFFLMDRVAFFQDGWIAIARLQPYRVDWRAPDGTMTVGPTISPSRGYDDADKLAYLRREAAASGKAPRTLSNTFGWPEFMPAFAGLAPPVLAAPDGKLWIARVVSAAENGARYDVIDRRGALAGVLMLPENARVVGLGAKAVYVAVTDEDGIQHLSRHPWP